MLAARLLMMAAAGRNRSAQPFWNSADKDSDITLSDSDRTASASDQGSVRSTVGKSSGKWYVEFLAVDAGSSSTGYRIGLANSSHTITQELGSSANGWAYRGNGTKITNNSGSAYGTAIADTDIVGMAVDFAAGKVWWRLNGTWQASGDPEAGTNEGFSSLSGTLYLAFSGGASRSVTLRLLADYTGSTPAGFTKGW